MYDEWEGNRYGEFVVERSLNRTEWERVEPSMGSLHSAKALISSMRVDDAYKGRYNWLSHVGEGILNPVVEKTEAVDRKLRFYRISQRVDGDWLVCEEME